jgi:hypothetical protein
MIAGLYFKYLSQTHPGNYFAVSSVNVSELTQIGVGPDGTADDSKSSTTGFDSLHPCLGAIATDIGANCLASAPIASSGV